MSTNKIYCFGDGYAHGHIWPEWPQILETLLPTYEVTTISGIGAGPEYLVTQFSRLLPIKGIVIFQWPLENRFDKIIQDRHWEQVAASDPVYHSNLYKTNNETWWLSSASNVAEVKQYHSKFVQTHQAKVRLTVYQTLVKEILEKSNCPYFFTSNFEQEYYSQKDLEIRGEEIQPSTLSHFYFLTKIIMPALKLNSDKIDLLEHLIKLQTWVPFDPDRQEIWNKIKCQLKNNSDK